MGRDKVNLYSLMHIFQHDLNPTRNTIHAIFDMTCELNMIQTQN
jgi:hypothetical protein